MRKRCSYYWICLLFFFSFFPLSFSRHTAYHDISWSFTFYFMSQSRSRLPSQRHCALSAHKQSASLTNNKKKKKSAPTGEDEMNLCSSVFRLHLIIRVPVVLLQLANHLRSDDVWGDEKQQRTEHRKKSISKGKTRTTFFPIQVYPVAVWVSTKF